MVDCMKEIGTPVEKARMLAANLSEADFRGHFSHGLNRLAYYVSDIKHGMDI
jgi:LDH2 family malate/lactate/ureidoglycolate dehydrogenase